MHKLLSISSLLNLPTSKRTRRLITHVTISLYQSSLQCATPTTTTPPFASRYDLQEFRDCRQDFDYPCISFPVIHPVIHLSNFFYLQGVVRKTLSDDLVENIWEPVHMDKIVPSLLYNMQNARHSEKPDATPESPTEERSDPPQFAETCMRELVGRASFGHIRCVIKPVLRYLEHKTLYSIFLADVLIYVQFTNKANEEHRWLRW